MANITTTPGYTFTSGETVEANDLNLLGSPTVAISNIVDADIGSGAAIALSKLATGALPAAITTTTANIVDASVTPAKLSQPYTLATAQASTSGTSIDFTGIPSWVKRITIMFSAVSTNANSTIGIQIGSGSFATSGYSGTMWASASAAQRTDMFPVFSTVSAANNACGIIVLQNISSNNWVQFGNMVYGNAQSIGWSSAGQHTTLSGALDRVRVTTVAGDAFDAGSINIAYEA